MTEDEFKANVIELAQTLGWLIHHDRPAWDPQRGGQMRTAIEGHTGFPDLVLAKTGRRTVFAELKAEVGRLSKPQEEWIRNLLTDDLPPIVDIWRPSDIQRIAQLLGPRGVGS